MLPLPDPVLRALAAGECIVAFVDRSAAAPGDEVALAGDGPLPTDDLKPAYRRWAAAGPPPGSWTAVVEDVHPAAALDPEEGSARHILEGVPAGDLVVLRVAGPEGPVLSDAAFAARRASVGGAIAG